MIVREQLGSRKPYLNTERCIVTVRDCCLMGQMARLELKSVNPVARGAEAVGRNPS